MSLINVTKVGHFSGHKGAVYTIQRALGDHEFYSGGNDGYVVRWDMNKQDEGRLLVQVNRPVYSLFTHRESAKIYCGTAGGNLHEIDLASGKETRNIEAHGLGIFDMCLYRDQLITCGGDGMIRVWNRATLELEQQMTASEKSARTVALDATGKWLAAGFSDHRIRLYDTADFSLKHTLNAHENSVFSVAFSKDGRELLSGGRDAMLRSWLMHEDLRMDVNIAAHTLHINHIAFSPSGKYFVTVSMDKTIKLWGTEKMQLLKVLDKARNDGHSSSVNKCLWVSETRFVTGSDDRTVMMWEISSQMPD